MNIPTLIRFNYYPGSLIGEFPERYEERAIGVLGVVEIREHQACGEGDKWFYDIIYQTEAVERIFNPHQVFYTPKQQQ